MNVLIIQPPLLQLNAPYPSGAYLKAFFSSQGNQVIWKDGSIDLFYKVFSPSGLDLLYKKSKDKALSLAQRAYKDGDENTASILLNFLSSWPLYQNTIETINAVLSCSPKKSGRELCHSLIFSPHTPRGPRAYSFLENLGRLPGIDDARFLATMMLADLADYISMTFDPAFALVRYAESLSISNKSFATIEEGLDSPLLTNYWQPLLDQYFTEFSKAISCKPSENKAMVCISVPFPGTFAAALYAGRYFKKKMGDQAFVCLGGGFINTELRNVTEKNFYKYADALSYDRGYGSYKALMESGLLQKGQNVCNKSLYKLAVFSETSIIPPKEKDADIQKYENSLTRTITPDFSGIDFSRYLRMADDSNPMQRLWSDGSWMKAYLAHGCYWHKCSFCDVTLDYVCAYQPCSTEKVFESLYSQAKEHGIYGIHFVDEALPPFHTAAFARLNAEKGSPLSFWGNVRFEKVFTRDLADFLSYGGLIGVSGGIEIATGNGLSSIDKGTDIKSIVAACCAFKEAGILVHAYMIYGWWNESELDLMNSMETLRQLYQEGLLDSSFWHKFTLTRHSRLYAEWKEGKQPELKPLEDEAAGIFAKNGLHFKGEEKSKKFGSGLNAALNAWMHGKVLNKSVNKWFSFPTPSPTVAKDLVQKAVEAYEKERDAAFLRPLDIEKAYWLAGYPLLLGEKAGKKQVCWTYMQEDLSLLLDSKNSSYSDLLLSGLWGLRPSAAKEEREAAIKKITALQEKLDLTVFRGKGLVQFF